MGSNADHAENLKRKAIIPSRGRMDVLVND